MPNCEMQPLAAVMATAHNNVYEIRSRKDKRGVDLISDALPFGRLWYDTHAGEFKEW